MQLTFAALMTGVLALPASAGSWGDLGGFSLADARPGSAPRTTAWDALGAGVTWRDLDAFERSAPGKKPPSERAWTPPATGSTFDRIAAIIAFAESPRAGYDAIHGSARKHPSKTPTNMTLGEIHRWIKDTPGQHHAIGRYQIIPSTLVALQRRLGLPSSARFSPDLQDRMAGLLMADAGFHRFTACALPLPRFMANRRPTADSRRSNPKSPKKGVFHSVLLRSVFVG